MRFRAFSLADATRSCCVAPVTGTEDDEDVLECEGAGLVGRSPFEVDPPTSLLAVAFVSLARAVCL